jgi:hypothetical protein
MIQVAKCQLYFPHNLNSLLALPMPPAQAWACKQERQCKIGVQITDFKIIKAAIKTFQTPSQTRLITFHELKSNTSCFFSVLRFGNHDRLPDPNDCLQVKERA